MYWRGLVHDLSKFRMSEFVPYAQHFYDEHGRAYMLGDGWESDMAFAYAWMLHAHKNSHHWQFYVMPEDHTRVSLTDHEVTRSVVHAMPTDAVKEMVCDWIGVGEAQGTPDMVQWWIKNREKLILHPGTRKLVEELVLVKWNKKEVCERQ